MIVGCGIHYVRTAEHGHAEELGIAQGLRQCATSVKVLRQESKIINLF